MFWLNSLKQFLSSSLHLTDFCVRNLPQLLQVFIAKSTNWYNYHFDSIFWSQVCIVEPVYNGHLGTKGVLIFQVSLYTTTTTTTTTTTILGLLTKCVDYASVLTFSSSTVSHFLISSFALMQDLEQLSITENGITLLDNPA